MGFLPDNYEPPVSGNYMRLEQGDNKIRIMSPAIVGNEFWVSEPDGSRKPMRRRIGEPIEDYELGTDQHGQREKVKHFWAMTVWNYRANGLQILELTQRTVMSAVEALYRDTDWGDPSEYDIKITKSGSGLDTEYRVTPLPKAQPPQAASDAMVDGGPDLQALFYGGDPFAGSAGSTQQQSQQPANPSQAGTITQGNKTQMATETIHSVEQNGKWWGIKTTKGLFVVDDEVIGNRIKGYGHAEVAFTYMMRGDKRYILDAAPVNEPVGVGADDDDIPF